MKNDEKDDDSTNSKKLIEKKTMFVYKNIIIKQSCALLIVSRRLAFRQS